MINFLIQTIDGKIKHDFAFTLLESIEYHNWYQREEVMSYSTFVGIPEKEMFSLPKNHVPVGSNEFVLKCLSFNFNLFPKPKNVPEELMEEEFLLRNAFNGTDKDIKGEKFVKSNDKIKGFTEITDNAPPGNYFISDLVEIESEWRSFVYKNELVGLQNYGGDFTMFPNVNKIREMIACYKPSAPIAYTLDVALNDKGQTLIIEVHDFFSCGLYGFNDHKIYPYMLQRWYHEYLQKNK